MQRPAAPRKAPTTTSRSRGAGRALRVAGGLCWSGVRAAARRPAVLLAGVAILGGAGVFAWNATMKQTARHPAPLFASAKPVAEPARRAEPASPQTTGATRADIPVPPSRSGGPDAIGSIIRTSEGPARSAETRPRSAEARPKQAEAKPKPVEAKKAPEAKKPAEAKPKPAAAKPVDPKAKAAAGPSADKPTPRVVSAQKALAKLGYGPIATDGRFGSNTRLAIEKFERDRKLPVTGALGPQTLKQLASRSGMSIE